MEALYNLARTTSNSTLLIRVGAAASLTLAKDLHVRLDENNIDLHVPQRKHRRLLAAFLKLMAGAFPPGLGSWVLPGSLQPKGLVPKSCFCQGSWE